MPELKLIETSSIVVSGRQRTESPAAALKELVEDIQKPHGLLHPVVVFNTTGDVIVLVAGERRLQAIQELEKTGTPYKFGTHVVSPNLVPALVLSGNLTLLELAEAELSENAARLQLFWQDVVRTRAELHKLRLRQNPGWRLGDSSKELSVAPQAISEAVILAQHLTDPVVASAPSLSKAKRYIWKKMESQFLAQLSEQERGAREPTHTLIEGDSFEELPRLSASTFDCIIADPPYGVSITEDRGHGRLQHVYDDTYDASHAAYKVLFREGLRVTKPDAHLYALCAIVRWPQLFSLASTCGWTPWFLPLIWWKGSTGRVPQPTRGPKMTYEAILYATKGDKCVTGIYPDVIHCPLDTTMAVPVQKPVALYTELLRRSCTIGDKILDPFCGTGTVFKAATELRLQATGIEKSPEMLTFARGKL